MNLPFVHFYFLFSIDTLTLKQVARPCPRAPFTLGGSLGDVGVDNRD
jgi:hypothetical protein